MTKLTKRQQEIMELIEARMIETGAPPTRAEIANIMGFNSPNAAEDHLRALARKGVIELIPGTSRGIRLMHNIGQIPIVNLNSIHTTQPILSDNHIDSTCKLDRSFFQSSIDYLLRVTDHDIPELAIAQGDYLVIHKTQEIQNGQIAVLRLNQDILVKRYSPELRVPHLSIEGIVIGVIRSLAEPPQSP